MKTHLADIIKERENRYMGNRGIKKPVYQKWWFWLVIVIVVLGIIGAIVGSQYTSPTDQGNIVSNQVESKADEAMSVNALDLIVAYEENQVSADNMYKNKQLKITGTVKSIGIDVADRAFVMLADERNEYAILGVQCYFDKDKQDTLSQLKEGDVITLTGKCEGKVVSVSVKNCKLNS